MYLSERVRDLRHRVAEIVGGLTGPQDYELDGAILAAFEALRAAAEAAALERAARILETKAAAFTGAGPALVDDDDPDRVRQLYIAAIRALK